MKHITRILGFRFNAVFALLAAVYLIECVKANHYEQTPPVTDKSPDSLVAIDVSAQDGEAAAVNTAETASLDTRHVHGPLCNHTSAREGRVLISSREGDVGGVISALASGASTEEHDSVR